MNGDRSRPLRIGLDALDLDSCRVAQPRRLPTGPVQQAGARWLVLLLKLAPWFLLVLGLCWIAGPVLKFFALLRDPPNALNRIATENEMNAVADLVRENARANQYCPLDLAEAISRPRTWEQSGFDPLADSWDTRYEFLVHDTEGAFSLISAGPDRRFARGDETEFASGSAPAPAQLKELLADHDDLLVQRSWRDH